MLLLIAVLLGLVFGSYLNVVIHRGPRAWGLADGVSAEGPRSRCPACDAAIRPQDLLPIASYLMLRGRCRDCGVRIPLRYPIVEAATAGAFVGAAAVFGGSVEWGLASIFVAFAIALAAIDHETGYLPDALTIPLLAGGLAFNTVDLFATLPDAIAGAAIGYLAFEAVRRIYAALRGREGLGGGDSKYLSAIGAWLGATALPAVVFVASITTLSVALSLGAAREPQRPVAFGPGLSAAGILFLLFGDWLAALTGL